MIGARDLYEQALKVEPENIDALAGVATTLVFEVLNGYYQTGNEQRLLEAEELLARTLAVEPRHLVALKASAALRRAQGKFEESIAAAEAVITENPGEPWAYKEIGFSAMYLGSPIAALDWFAKAERLWHKADMPPLSAIFPLSGDCVAKQFCPSERAVDVVAKSPPQHRTRGRQTPPR